ncbi:MAG TPA: type II toxin-antitoxin system RelE/ParE family toxin [Casimicrobiaceae bacterium]|nr:type II toxin-antitoxin system RelE/ParE family toxin [Casimicrobiaceae bacterium]
MVRGFRHKGLERFFRKGNHSGIPARSADRIRRMLDVLEAASQPGDVDLPGYRFHALKGNRAGTYSLTVTGNLRITFQFDGEDAIDVDLEDYH